jgi:catechol 2,3-dioxygenase-like lactoylglutathione lyase family enzyme
MEMPPLQRVYAVLAATVLSGGFCGTAAHTQERQPPVVQYIDHIMIRAHEPDELYAFFVDTLQLPVAWPLADRGGVTSGGVGFGNVNVEAIRFPGQSGEPTPTHLVGFAFKPLTLNKSLAELQRRGIAYGEPRPFVSIGPDGTRTTLFTNVTLSHFSDADQPAAATLHVFLSEYSPAYVDVDQRRFRLRHELAARAGGPLGLLRVEEIVVGTTDLDATTRLYEKLLEPTEAVSGAWRVGDGPSIRLVHAEQNVVQGLVIGVVSLSTARTFLEERELLGSASETQVTIARSKIHGVNLVLIEVGAADDDGR